MKLIQTKDYLLLIDEEAEILCIEKEILLSKDESLLCEITEINYRQHFRGINVLNEVKVSIAYHQLGDFYKVIAYYPLTKEAKELDLPLLPPFEKEVDVEELAEKESEKHHYAFGQQSEFYQLGFIEGYKAAQQSKQFTLDGVKKAIEMARMTFPTDKLSCDRYSTDHIIQSLSTQQLPVGFIPEIEQYTQNYHKDIWYNRIKTITNSEGKVVLVGTYKY